MPPWRLFNDLGKMVLLFASLLQHYMLGKNLITFGWFYNFMVQTTKILTKKILHERAVQRRNLGAVGCTQSVSEHT